MTITLNPQSTLKAHSRGLLTNRTLKPSEPSLEGEGVEGECECNQILNIYTQTNFNRGRHNAERIFNSRSKHYGRTQDTLR